MKTTTTKTDGIKTGTRTAKRGRKPLKNGIKLLRWMTTQRAGVTHKQIVQFLDRISSADTANPSRYDAMLYGTSQQEGLIGRLIIRIARGVYATPTGAWRSDYTNETVLQPKRPSGDGQLSAI